MVSPTLTGRIRSLDVLRGLAVLGILLANIVAFNYPMSEFIQLGIVPDTTPSNQLANTLINAFVTGKFRSLLAILFGVGLYLQFQKRVRVEGNWPGGYMKRMLFLLLLGLIHGLLIWFGDILFAYAITGFVACLLVGLDNRILTGIISGTFALMFLLAVACVGLAYVDIDPKMAFMGMDPLKEAAAYSSGSYLDQLAERGKVWGLLASSMVLSVPMFGSLFLLGIMLARNGVLRAPSKHKRARNLLLAIGFGAGLPLNLLAFVFWRTGASELFTRNWFELFAGPVLGIGYLILGAMWVEAGWLKPAQRLFENVGRVALSCYILQSLIATTVFYSWGFGLYGKLDLNQTLLSVAGIWAGVIAFAAIWLRYFDIGPVEWAWRSATEGRRLPWRGSEEQPPVAQQPPKPAFEI